MQGKSNGGGFIIGHAAELEQETAQLTERVMTVLSATEKAARAAKATHEDETAPAEAKAYALTLSQGLAIASALLVNDDALTLVRHGALDEAADIGLEAAVRMTSSVSDLEAVVGEGTDEEQIERLHALIADLAEASTEDDFDPYRVLAEKAAAAEAERVARDA
jgi:hypothetical protein